MKHRGLATLGLLAAALVIGVPATAAAGPAHHPLYMPDAQNTTNPALQPPPVCCIPVYQAAAGVPAPVNMAYFGGHVQVTPRIYLFFWGWGQAGAFDHATPGFPASDPDGAAARMTAFIGAMGFFAPRTTSGRRDCTTTSVNRLNRSAPVVRIRRALSGSA